MECVSSPFGFGWFVFGHQPSTQCELMSVMSEAIDRIKNEHYRNDGLSTKMRLTELIQVLILIHQAK